MKLFLQCQSRISITFKCIFLGKDHLLAEGHGIMFITHVRICRKYHISMYILRKIIFHFLSKEKISCFWGKNTIFYHQIIQEKSYSSAIFLKRPSFQKIWKKILYFHVFEERSSFMNCLKNKIIFLEKRNIIFPNNTRNIIIQCNFLGKTIFSGRLEKEIMVFVQWTPNGYWEKFWETLLFLKSKANFFDLRLEISSWACALRPRLKLIFHWNI